MLDLLDVALGLDADTLGVGQMALRAVLTYFVVLAFVRIGDKRFLGTSGLAAAGAATLVYRPDTGLTPASAAEASPSGTLTTAFTKPGTMSWRARRTARSAVPRMEASAERRLNRSAR